ncbi:hypothetical protein RRG08_011701 [Elysia crispata]|uniref:Uncharacterized protein n=1 Tax=Elysia crispata TaxID=231223 RepID=A0AAE1BCR6_9GAST|nr:hypothetical protein RRG08_011701 [Elysia crispata]
MDAGARGSSGGSFISMTRAETREKEMETNELMIRPHRVATALNCWSFRRLAALNGEPVEGLCVCGEGFNGGLGMGEEVRRLFTFFTPKTQSPYSRCQTPEPAFVSIVTVDMMT